MFGYTESDAKRRRGTLLFAPLAFSIGIAQELPVVLFKFGKLVRV